MTSPPCIHQKSISFRPSTGRDALSTRPMRSFVEEKEEKERNARTRTKCVGSTHASAPEKLLTANALLIFGSCSAFALSRVSVTTYTHILISRSELEQASTSATGSPSNPHGYFMITSARGSTSPNSQAVRTPIAHPERIFWPSCSRNVRHLAPL